MSCEICEKISAITQESILSPCFSGWGNNQELEGKEAHQRGSLSKEKAIDKAVGKGEEVFSLCRKLLSGMKERYPGKENNVNFQSKWTTMEGDIQYLTELAVLEVVCNDLDNNQVSKYLDDIQCM